MKLEDFGIITGIVSVGVTAAVFLVKEYKKAQIKFRIRLKGNWTNEGDILLSVLETHYIDMEITVDEDNGEIGGSLNCRNKETDDEMNYMSIDGKTYFNTGKFDIIDIKGRRIETYANVSFKIQNKNLIWKLTGGSNVLFPDKTLLWKTDINSFSDLQPFVE